MIVLSVEVDIRQYLVLHPVLAQRILVVDIMYLMKVQKNLIMNVNIAGVGIQQYQVFHLALVLKTRRGGIMFQGGNRLNNLIATLKMRNVFRKCC